MDKNINKDINSSSNESKPEIEQGQSEQVQSTEQSGQQGQPTQQGQQGYYNLGNTQPTPVNQVGNPYSNNQQGHPYGNNPYGNPPNVMPYGNYPHSNNQQGNPYGNNYQGNPYDNNQQNPYHYGGHQPPPSNYNHYGMTSQSQNTDSQKWNVSFFTGNLIWMLGIIGALVVSFAVVFFVVIFFFNDPYVIERPAFQITALVTLHATFTIITIAVIKSQKKNVLDVIRLKRGLNLKQFFWVVVLSLAVLPAFYFTAVGFNILLGFLGFFREAPEAAVVLSTPLSRVLESSDGMMFGLSGHIIFIFLVYVLFIGVMPSISEEFWIRGGAMRGLENKSKRFAVFMSGLMFMIMHMNPAQTFPHIILGFIFAYIVIETNSLWSAMILHFIYNTSIVALNLFGAFDLLGYMSLTGFGIFLIICAVVGVPLVLLSLYYISKASADREAEDVRIKNITDSIGASPRSMINDGVEEAGGLNAYTKATKRFSIWDRVKEYNIVKPYVPDYEYIQMGGQYYQQYNQYGYLETVFVPNYVVRDKNKAKNIWGHVFMWVGLGISIGMWLMLLSVGIYV
ncbi:MAG: CPBP family glutamic-type intramembrane protease [Firmicutes bacterium]|nr:CPBP family glutamic-type intramembrane protease [Bacillota bacterium]